MRNQALCVGIKLGVEWGDDRCEYPGKLIGRHVSKLLRLVLNIKYKFIYANFDQCADRELKTDQAVDILSTQRGYPNVRARPDDAVDK